MTAAVSSLAEVALAFCREVMGVASCDIGATKPLIVWETGSFDYTDLTVIAAEVHKWCKAHFCQWAVFGNDTHEDFEWLAFVLPFDDFWEARCDTASGPQQAILTACLEASRKLRAG